MRAGFDLVGVASAKPLQKDSSNLGNWLNLGYAAGMDYLNRNPAARGDPREFLPGAETVVVAAASYPWPGSRAGHLAAYAIPRDYHLVFRAALNECVSLIKAHDPVAECAIAVDSSPLLERALARRAGIGWIGYSTNLLTRDFGPSVLLCAIVTTMKIKTDRPLDQDLKPCADCKKCIEACPTGALASPYTLDSSRCISYLTIEKKGPFDDNEADSIGGSIFGCDRCTSACMQNGGWKISSSPGPLFPPGVSADMTGLENLLNMCEEGFKRNFKETALYRTGKNRIIRNILTAAKNLDLPWVVKRAEKYIESPHPATRSAAERAVKKC